MAGGPEAGLSAHDEGAPFPVRPRSHREARAALELSLGQTFDALEPWLEVGPEVWAHRPAGPEGQAPGWSVGEVLEHLTLAQHYLLILVEKTVKRARRLLDEGRQPPAEPTSFAALEALSGRALPWTHPEHMTPTGSVGRDELRRRLADQRRRCLAALAALPDGAGRLHTLTMSVVGQRLDLYQWLRLIDLHARRHLAQMERAQASAQE